MAQTNAAECYDQRHLRLASHPFSLCAIVVVVAVCLGVAPVEEQLRLEHHPRLGERNVVRYHIPLMSTAEQGAPGLSAGEWGSGGPAAYARESVVLEPARDDLRVPVLHVHCARNHCQPSVRRVRLRRLRFDRRLAPALTLVHGVRFGLRLAVKPQLVGCRHQRRHAALAPPQPAVRDHSHVPSGYQCSHAVQWGQQR